jgi:hypothetical protein
MEFFVHRSIFLSVHGICTRPRRDRDNNKKAYLAKGTRYAKLYRANCIFGSLVILSRFAECRTHGFAPPPLDGFTFVVMTRSNIQLFIPAIYHEPINPCQGFPVMEFVKSYADECKPEALISGYENPLFHDIWIVTNFGERSRTLEDLPVKRPRPGLLSYRRRPGHVSRLDP